MTAPAEGLYAGVVVDHGKRPRNRRRLAAPTATAEGVNPLCGDRVTVFLAVADGIVREAAFDGEGCAIATASASMMTEAVRGRSPVAAGRLASAFRELVANGAAPVHAEVGELAAFAPVRAFPSRMTCAMLPWETLERALAAHDAPERRHA